MPPNTKTEATTSGGYPFPDTLWTVVVQASDADPGRAHQALEQLCGRYWKPLYGSAKRKGFSHEDAEDLTQRFIIKLLEKNAFRAFERRQAKFRTFLRDALGNFLIDEWRRKGAAKRDASRSDSLEALEREPENGVRIPTSPAPEDRCFDRDWANELIHRAITQLRLECETQGPEKLQLFEQLQERLLDEADADFYEQVGVKLHKNLGAVKTAHSRLKGRLKELVRKEIADTVGSHAEIDEEIKYLLSVLGQ